MSISNDNASAPRARSVGLGWQKRMLLACSLVGLVGSLTVYAASAAALVNPYGVAESALGTTGLLTPATGELGSSEDGSQGLDNVTADAPSGAAVPGGQNAAAAATIDGAPTEGQAPPSDAGISDAGAPTEGAAAADGEATVTVFPSVSPGESSNDANGGASAHSSKQGSSSGVSGSSTAPSASSGATNSSNGGSGSAGTAPSGSKPAASGGSSSGSKPSGSGGSSSNSTPSAGTGSSGGSSSSAGSSSASGGSGAPSSGGSSSSTGSGSGSGAPSSSGGTSSGTSSSGDTATAAKPVASASTGLSEATEQKIHKQLTAKYDALAPLAEDVAAICADFDATVDGASPEECESAQEKAKRLYDKVSEAASAMQSVSVPAKSKYHGKYADMVTLYDDLLKASDVLRRAWAVACGSVDVSGKTEPRQVVAAYADASGNLEVLKDYEKRYPGARP